MSMLSPRKAVSMLIPRAQNSPLKAKQTQEQLIQAQITMLMWKLDNFTVDLQSKVDGLLHHQQQEFFKAYKGYLGQLRSSLTVLQIKLQEQNRKIEQYESSGELSKLIRRNNEYETELNRMYSVIVEKDKTIQDSKIQIEALQKDNKQLHLSLKLMMKERTHNRMKNMASPPLIQSTSNRDFDTNDAEHTANNIFATEIKDKQTDKTNHQESIGLIFPQRSPHENQHQKSSISRRKPYYEAQFLKLKKEVKFLRERNTSLLKDNVESVSQQSEFQEFFLRCVNDVKKQICSRNNLTNCQYSDFKKEDKMKLLLNIVSNDKIITSLNQVLFADKAKPVSVFQYVEETIQNDKSSQKMETVYVAPSSGKRHSLAKVRMHSEEQQKKLPQINEVRGLRHKRKKAFPNYMTTKRFSDVY